MVRAQQFQTKQMKETISGKTIKIKLSLIISSSLIPKYRNTSQNFEKLHSTLDLSNKQSTKNPAKRLSFMQETGSGEDMQGKPLSQNPSNPNIESSGMVINPKVMEVWLNDILSEAQDLELKS